MRGEDERSASHSAADAIEEFRAAGVSGSDKSSPKSAPSPGRPPHSVERNALGLDSLLSCTMR
ncbi:MAG: hypothetical protein JWP05_2666 [Microbacteriaceae bacterium]|jgi:hypothetical protein|nr:hypothetical protein [Microbacteriaceae bacterium]